MRHVALTLLLFRGALAPASAREIADGAWLAGAGGGAAAPMGSAKDAGGSPYLLGGQLVYHQRGDMAWGLQVDRVMFQAKDSKKTDASLLTLVARKNVGNDFEKTLPYLLAGLGYSEAKTQVRGVGDRGSGPAISLGFGLDRFVAERVTVGGELRFLRAAAPLASLGSGGISAVSLIVRINGVFGPDGDPFSP